jgi:hypothetical protein
MFYLKADLKKKNVVCFFNNAKLAASVNILFLCVLPSQLPFILDEIKTCLPEKCILYNFVVGFSEKHLKLLLGEHNLCTQFIIKSNIEFSKDLNFLLPQWKNFLGVVECLCNQDMVSLINPFSSENESNINT